MAYNLLGNLSKFGKLFVMPDAPQTQKNQKKSYQGRVPGTEETCAVEKQTIAQN
jgi:hypothetical protein